MILYTLQIAKYKLAINSQLLLTDTTVKSGGNSPFKPTWELVMRESYKTRQAEWIDFLTGQNRAVIACYCQSGKFCHRYILAELLEKVATSRNIPFTYAGELT